MTIQDTMKGPTRVQHSQTELETQIMHGALASIHRASRGTPADDAGAAFVQDHHMTLSIASNLPSSAIVLNHGIIDPDSDTVSWAANIYRKAGVERFFLSSMQELSAEAMSAANLTQARGWRLFRRALADPGPDRPTNIAIAKVRFGQAMGFAKIVSDAFDLGDAARSMLATLPDAEGWHVFQAESDGRPMGTGALFVSGQFAWTDFGATAPEHRGKGVQKALLARRIEFARSLGCHTILTCTGEEVPGEDQISYRNILNAGFREAELMFNFAPK